MEKKTRWRRTIKETFQYAGSLKTSFKHCEKMVWGRGVDVGDVARESV